MAERAPFARDEPVELARDAFGHADYVRALATIVTDPDAPSTVGLFGPWGVGKSTIVEGLADELPTDVAFVYFDAWRYDAGDSLRRQFLRDVGGQLDAAEQLKSDFKVERELQDLDVDTQTTTEALAWSKARAAKALLIGFVLGLIVFVVLITGTGDFLKSDKMGQRIAASVVAALIGFVASLLNQVIVVKETVISRRSLQDPDRFADRFAALLNAAKPDRLVIAVDNLDRCAPDRAVEMLSTIKTYLEPALREGQPPASGVQKAVDKQVCFVIALDDAALRRHLIAREAHRSAMARSDSEHVESYVEEYLAKFFSTRLPIRPILRDDIRGYIEKHLDPLIAARHFEPNRKQLVQLAGAALRRNPRHVKQFVNDLESRLRLIDERETQHGDIPPAISPPISDQILMIAKLGLLETEWPRAFQRLQREPKVLEQWHEEAESATEVWFDGEASDQAEAQSAARDFASFLRTSRSIGTIHLRAILSLKQSATEAGLPGFPEFREAVVNEDRAGVERTLADVTEAEREKYVARMPGILRDELDQGYVDGARAVVGMVVSVEQLQSFDETRTEVLAEAVKDVDLREQLAFLDPEPLLTAGERLEQPDRQALVGCVVERFVGEDRPEAQRQSAAQALARAVSELSENDRRRISELIQDQITSRFEVYEALADAAPELLPPGVAVAAVEALRQADEQGRDSLAGRDATFTVGRAAIPRNSDRDLNDSVVQLVIQKLESSKPDPEAFSITVHRALELLNATDGASEAQWNELAQQLVQQWGTYPAEVRDVLLRIGQLAIERAPEAERPPIATNLAQAVFSDPEQGVQLVGILERELSGQVIGPVVEELTNVARTQAQHRMRAAELMCRLAGEGVPDRLAQVMIAAAQQGNDDHVVALLDAHGDSLASEGPRIANEILTWSDQQAPEATLPYGALIRLEAFMGDAERVRMGDLLASRIEGGSPGALESFGLDWPERTIDMVLGRIVERLMAHPQFDGAAQNLLTAIAPRLDRLSDEDQERMVRHLQAWMTSNPQSANGIATTIQTMEGLRAKSAEPLVGALIDTSRQVETGVDPATLLIAAGRISGGRNTRASKRLYKYLEDELGEGSENDQSLAVQVIEALKHQ